MQTKLTLRLDSQLIKSAKQYAGRKGRSLSQMVAEYFKSFGRKNSPDSHPITPLVASMRGIMKGAKISGEKEWHRRWEKKYL